MTRIGVYVCHCGLNIAGVVDVKAVAAYARELPGVVLSKDYVYMCSEPGQGLIQEDIRKHRLDRVVIATCSPRMHEDTFRRAVAEAGLNAYMIEIVNLREQVAWPHAHKPEEATEKAKTLVRMCVARVKQLEPLQRKTVLVDKHVLVLGGGIAGIQATLDLANAGFKVYLVEKSPSIGGRMAQLDKTFPTLDCSACILTPRMVDVAKHPNVTLMTNAEVTAAEGYVGNYEITVQKNPSFVDESKCVGCELCSKACPVKVPDGFNVGLTHTRAISIYSPHSVPKTARIDKNYCLRLKTGKKEVCGKCLTACEAKAIDFEQKPETVRLKVGGVILAVGSKVFDASAMTEFSYGRFPNVVSNMEFERISDASGPTGGKIISPRTGKQPQSIVFVQCVGSRDRRFHDYCCRVGCMVTLKQAILAREKLGDNVNIYVCYNDLRAFGKGYEEFYARAREMNIDFVGGFPSDIRMKPDGSLYFDVFECGTAKLLEMRADMVVLASGLVPNDDLTNINELFHVSRSADGFLLEAHPKLRPLESSTAGVFLAGACQGPKDIPDTVAQASGVAARVIDLLSKGEIELEPLKAIVDEDLCSGCRVCESLCPFAGIEIKTREESSPNAFRAEVVEAMCQGCGLCGAACPTGAIKMQQYSSKQVIVQVDAACEEDEQSGGTHS